MESVIRGRWRTQKRPGAVPASVQGSRDSAVQLLDLALGQMLFGPLENLLLQIRIGLQLHPVGVLPLRGEAVQQPENVPEMAAVDRLQGFRPFGRIGLGQADDGLGELVEAALELSAERALEGPPPRDGGRVCRNCTVRPSAPTTGRPAPREPLITVVRRSRWDGLAIPSGPAVPLVGIPRPAW